MTEPAHPTTPHDAEIVATNETPHIRTVITRTPDGACQSTVTVTVQVATTLGPPAPTAATRSPDEDDTNTGGGSKGGLGVQRIPSEVKSSDDDDTNPGSKTKGGLGVERKS